jgi:hypothetical protein
MNRLVPPFLLAASVLIAALAAPSAAQTADATLSEAQALIAHGQKGEALALLAGRLDAVAQGDPAADNLLLFAIRATRYEKAVQRQALSRLDAGQAIRLEQAAETNGDPAWLRRDLLARWRELGGTNAETTLRLARLRAWSDSSDDAAVALLEELAQSEGASGETRAEATRLLDGLRRPIPVEALENPELAESLTAPSTLDGLEAAWELALARRAQGLRDRERDSLLLYTAACEKPFYLAHIADGQVSAASRAALEEQLVWALTWTTQFDKCATAAARLIALEGAPEAQVGAARYCAADALAGDSELEASIEAMWQFVEFHPSHALMPDALYSIARALVGTHHRPEALAQFKLIVELYPDTNAGAQAAAWISRWSQLPGYAELEEAAELAVFSNEASSRHMAAIEEVRRRLLAQAPAALPAIPGVGSASASANATLPIQPPLTLAAESLAAR